MMQPRKLREYIGFPLNTTYKTWAVNHCAERAYYSQQYSYYRPTRAAGLI